MKKKVPYAIANYEKIREGNYFFVDKTRYIKELEKYNVPVLLRPRRFGKTLLCSILECYYDINRRDKFKLSAKRLREFGVGRNSGYKALKRLEDKGLIKVERHNGQLPLVSVVELTTDIDAPQSLED